MSPNLEIIHLRNENANPGRYWEHSHICSLRLDFIGWHARILLFIIWNRFNTRRNMFKHISSGKKSKLIGRRTGCGQKIWCVQCCWGLGTCRKLGTLENKELADGVNAKYKSISTSFWRPQDNQLYIYLTTMLIKKKYQTLFSTLARSAPWKGSCV